MIPNENFLFKILTDQARPLCRWIGLWDVDEYYAAWRPDPIPLLQYLEAQPSGTATLPWFSLTHNGQETRPRGFLTTEIYSTGLFGRLVKAVGRSDLITTWTNSHKFRYFKPAAASASTNQHPDSELWILHPECGKVNNATWFIKHYKFRSWEEYIGDRGIRLRNPNGTPEMRYSLNPRQTWENASAVLDPDEGPPVKAELCQVAREFTAVMAARTRAALIKRWGNVDGPLGTITPNVRCEGG